MKSVLLALVWGAVFGLGLVISGMVQPANVLAFLDFSGAWDPRLMFVMAAALSTFAVLRPSILRLGRARLGNAFPSKVSSVLDARLVGGAVVFGVGWGVVGFCPGPAVVAAGSGSLDALIVAGAMIVGIRVADAARSERLPQSEPPEAGEACSRGYPALVSAAGAAAYGWLRKGNESTKAARPAERSCACPNCVRDSGHLGA